MSSKRDEGEIKVNTIAEGAKLLKPYWPIVIVSTISIVLFSLGILARPIVLQRVIDDGLIGGDGSVVVAMAIVFVVLAALVYVTEAAATYTVNWLGQNFLRDLRMKLFSHYQRLSMSFFDGENSGRLISRMTSDVNAMQDVLNHGFLLVVQSGLLLIGTIVILNVLSWQLSLVALAILPPLIIATLIFRIYSARAYEAVRDRIADVLVHMQESFAGMRIVQAFAREKHNMGRFGAINEDNYQANMLTVKLSSMYIPFIEWLGGLAIGIILYFGGRWVIGDQVTVGTVAAFIFYLEFIFQPIQHLSQLYDLFQSGAAAMNKIFRLLAVEPEVKEPEQPVALADVAGRIAFEHVTFGYAPEHPVLHDVDVTIESGQRVALVGATGAGKSTMAKLALRFYDPTEGRVTIDGTDLRDVRSEELRRAITLVPQEGFIFTGTVRENLLFGRPDASDAEMVQACRDLGVHNFIESLPDGYDTALSYRGSRLSSGEKQLVSLARAFLADPPVLLLDEATSSLDPGTEALMEQALRRLFAGRTSIVVAHRLSTAEASDRVLVVEDGRLVEDGHHNELVELGGQYAAMYEKWAPAQVSVVA